MSIISAHVSLANTPSLLICFHKVSHNIEAPSRGDFQSVLSRNVLSQFRLLPMFWLPPIWVRLLLPPRSYSNNMKSVLILCTLFDRHESAFCSCLVRLLLTFISFESTGNQFWYSALCLFYHIASAADQTSLLVSDLSVFVKLNQNNKKCWQLLTCLATQLLLLLTQLLPTNLSWRFPKDGAFALNAQLICDQMSLIFSSSLKREF